MLVLLVMIVLVELFQPDRLMRAFVSLPTTKERDSIFVGSGVDNRVKVLMVFFHVLLISISLMWITGLSHYNFLTFLVYVGLTSIMVMTRYAMQQLVAYTFFRKADLETMTRHYHYLSDSMVLLAYPITLAALFYPPFLDSGAATICIILLLVLYFGLMVFKLLTCIPPNWKVVLYLPLYVCTVEMLPMAALLFACQHVLTI